MITNILVVLTISGILALFGVGPRLDAYGIDYPYLITFCLVWGMGGAFISLLLSRKMAKWLMGVKIINSPIADPTLLKLVTTVETLSRQAGLTTAPQVGIYDSPEVNAFATGPTKNRSLIAVSTGLLAQMDSDSIEGVLGHEIAHIANGDMVTMTLLQGLVNAFVMFAARVIALAINASLRSGRNRGGLGRIGYILTVIVLEMAFMIVGSMVIARFSRWREFRADSGGAQLAGQDKMISALQTLQSMKEINAAPGAQTAAAFANMKISSNRNPLIKLLSTHPSLEERIARLEGSNLK
jgi:heat shock protein HtpX